MICFVFHVIPASRDGMLKVRDQRVCTCETSKQRAAVQRYLCKFHLNCCRQTDSQQSGSEIYDSRVLLPPCAHCKQFTEPRLRKLVVVSSSGSEVAVMCIMESIISCLSVEYLGVRIVFIPFSNCTSNKPTCKQIIYSQCNEIDEKSHKVKQTSFLFRLMYLQQLCNLMWSKK